MKKQMVTCLSGLGVLITLGAGMLTGCTEKNVDYSIDGIREMVQTEGNGGKNGLTQFAGEARWEDMWEASGGRMIKVKADILLPEADQMSVVEVQAPECNAEYKERMAKSLFDNETVYYHDLEHLTKKDLQKLYDQYKERYDADTDDSTMRSLDEEKMAEIEAAMEYAGSDYTPADEYEGDEYIGEYGGIEYVLSFGYDPNNDGQFYSTDIEIYVNDRSALCPKEYEGWIYCMGYPDTDMIENECRLSETEAEKLAIEFIEKLGLEYPILSDTELLLWGDMSSYNYQDWIANGYVFHFEYGLDGVSFLSFGSDQEYLSINSNVTGFPESDEAQYLTDTELTIYVTEQGIVQMTARNPVMTTGITESVKLLSLDTIKDIMKERIAEDYDDFHFDAPLGGKALEFTHMELIYFRVTDNENPKNYSYIPAWRLSKQTGDEYGRYINNPVIINAIDGSVIKLQAR